MPAQQINGIEIYKRDVQVPYTLDNGKKVHGRGLAEGTLLWGIVGETPGTDEEREGKPFVGKHGQLLDSALYHRGMNRMQCWMTNAITVRPPANRTNHPEAVEAIEAQQEEFWAEITHMVKVRGIKTIIALGNLPLEMFGISGNILKVRGSVFPMTLAWKGPVTDPNTEPCDFVVIPTYHPSYMLTNGHYERGGQNVSMYQIWDADFQKAKEIGVNGYTMLQEDFDTDPGVEDVVSFVEKAIATEQLVALDIETDGLNPMADNIVTLGLSLNATSGISIRLRNSRRELHHTQKDTDAIYDSIQRLLDNAAGFILQNAKYDLKWLLLKGFRFDWKKLKHDTMVLHHILNPELPHNLGFITSVYGQTPYWKDMGKWEEGTIYEREPKILGTYNIRDCVVLHQILPPMLKDLEEMGPATVDLYYNEAIPMIKVTAIMEMNGCPWDEKKKQEIADAIYDELPLIEASMRSLAGIPDFVDFRASVLTKLFYDVNPSNLAKHQETVEKSKPTTKKYQDAELELKIFSACKQIWMFTPAQFSPEKTPSGAYATHDKSRTRLAKAAAKRLDILKNLKAPTAGHEAEAKDIQRLLDFISLFNKFTELEKLRTTYLPYTAGRDKRIHPDWRSTGTNTGRLSCIAKGERILTKRGSIPIEDVQVGDKVLTHKGNIKDVTAVLKQGKKRVYRLTLSNSRSIICTDDHKIWTPAGWTLAKDTKEIYYVNTKRNIGRKESCREDSVSVSRRRKETNNREYSHRIGRNISQYNVCFGEEGRSFSIQGRKGTEMVSLQSGGQLPHEGENRREASQLEGYYFGQQGALHNNSRGDALLLSQSCNGEDARDTSITTPRELNCTSYRRRPIEQRSRKLSSLHKGRTQETSQKVGEVTLFTYLGEMEVYDLSVRDDESFTVSSGIIVHNCKNPNLMTLPKPNDEAEGPDWGGMFRACVKAPPHFKVVSADYAMLEVGTVAYESNEPNLIKIFEAKLSQHDINAKTLFGIDETHKNWKAARQAAKVFQFGSLNYGGGDNTVYSQMVEKAPELGLTMAQFKRAKENYFAANPEYARWKARVQQRALNERMGENAFGRKRVFYGQAHSIEKEALNFPCQSAAASIINRATIRIVDRLEVEFPIVELILQIHDQLVFLVPDYQIDSFCRMLKEEMERPVRFYEKERVFPIEIEIGDDFQNLTKWEVA